ncbi:toxin-antitoxin system YwqK family antitoxin [Adhaeretor mobilis]|uniref:Uncharacterized protein n=1 Tax=Adhaeretor mobilis TaxID=1930276 RepID=A0A517N2N0_9BACT|nr:hypothetical protein [Adhaeretor mobilis]QDT01396.1 hypothetical protein HG15A2_47380 [Adhaeretor mobilis]
MSEARRPRKLVYLLSGLAVALFLLVVMSIYVYPRQQELSFNPAYIGTYRGVGLHDGAGYFGKNWFRVHWETDDGISTEVLIDDYGYGPFQSYYPDGELRGTGLCLVEPNGGMEDPMPDEHDVLQGKFYAPDGSLLSEVINGTGTQTLCDAAGNIIWKLRLKAGTRREHWMFSSDGVTLSHTRYDHDELVNGAYISEHYNGKPKARGRYRSGYGSTVGNWYRFHDDGSLESITDHDTEPPAEQKFERGERFPTPKEQAEIRAIEAELEEPTP